MSVEKTLKKQARLGKFSSVCIVISSLQTRIVSFLFSFQKERTPNTYKIGTYRYGIVYANLHFLQIHCYLLVT